MLRNTYFLITGILLISAMLMFGYYVYESENRFNEAAGWSFEHRIEIDEIEKSNWVIIGVYQGVLNSGLSVQYVNDKSNSELAKLELTKMGCPVDISIMENPIFIGISDEQFYEVQSGGKP